MTISSRQDNLPIAEAFASLVDGPLRLRFTAYDGSSAGPADADIGLHLRTQRAAAYLVTAPGSIGLARAYISGHLELTGVHPGDPYHALRALGDAALSRRPERREVLRLATAIGVRRLIPPPPPPPQEAQPEWRRIAAGRLHSRSRDSDAIHHHYDVSNRFYEHLLGPSMTYTCACYPTAGSTLEEAQWHKYDLVARKLDLSEGMRLLDVGCGWGGMVIHAAREYGVRALGVTLSREQAMWAREEIKRQRLDHLA
ncbi:MAG: class I SAM-dependent methyltransferase, partial [Thermocrispum sp.]